MRATERKFHDDRRQESTPPEPDTQRDIGRTVARRRRARHEADD